MAKKPKKYESSYYAATLLYKDEDDLAQIEGPFISDLLGDVLSDVVIDRGVPAHPDDICVFIEDALTVSTDESHARVFIVQALHPKGGDDAQRQLS